MVAQNSNVVWMAAVVGLLVIIVTFILLLPGPGDFTPPSVGIAYPDEGAIVRGVVDIGLYATDASGIERVEVSLGCRHTLATFTGEPYTTTWDTTTLAVGPYQLCLTAWDRAGLRSRVTRDVSVVRQE